MRAHTGNEEHVDRLLRSTRSYVSYLFTWRARTESSPVVMSLTCRIPPSRDARFRKAFPAQPATSRMYARFFFYLHVSEHLLVRTVTRPPIDHTHQSLST